MTLWDKVTNVLLVAMCLVTVGVAGDHFILHNLASESSGIGSRLTGDLEGLIAPNATATAVVVVASKCKFCVASADFYRRLADFETKNGGFRVTFVSLMDIDDAKVFATAAGLPLESVRATPGSLRSKVQGTPALFVVNSKGQVAGDWTGQLTAGKEESVFETIRTVLATQSPTGTPGN